MKKTYYLFNPGTLERKDNTLKFTPLEEDAGGNELRCGTPRYLPVEDISEFYVFGSLKASSSLFNFLGQKDIAVHFLIITKIIQALLCLEILCCPVE
jgi:CRISPR-associated protein Cas1